VSGEAGDICRLARWMTGYYVLGICFVLFALGLTAFGLTREGFPPAPTTGRALMAAAGLIAVTTFAVLVATSHREHPREEAKKKAAEKRAEQAPGGQAGNAQKAPATAQVVEKEYSIALPNGTSLKAGKQTFDVTNQGTIQHDVAIEGAKGAKTPLIDPGKSASLSVDLKPGKYKLYCTVPGHEQLGMKAEVTVG
jgi:uncharacterized cupredoxin-like copper-binding protein